MKRRGFACMALTAALSLWSPVLAQNTDPTGFNAKYRGVGDFDHVHDQWYEAPREIQIIDERPVVREFRETPQTKIPARAPAKPRSELRTSGRFVDPGAHASNLRPPAVPFQGTPPPLIPAKDGRLPADAGDYSMPPAFIKPGLPLPMKRIIQPPESPSKPPQGILLKRVK